MVGNPEVIPPIFRKILAAAVGRTGRSVPVLLQFAEPDVAVADWVIVILQGKREFFWAGGVRRPHAVAGGAGQLDGALIFCYTVRVEKCVQKAGDSSRFFYFRHLLIGFRGYVKARHRRARYLPHIYFVW
jgi:hypothetical protein